MLLSPAVWAIIIAHFCNNWGFYTLLTCMPTFFKQALPELQQIYSGVCTQYECSYADTYILFYCSP